MRYRLNEIAKKKRRKWNNWGLVVKFESCKRQSSDLDRLFFFFFLLPWQLGSHASDWRSHRPEWRRYRIRSGISQLTSKHSTKPDQWLTGSNTHRTPLNFIFFFSVAFEDKIILLATSKEAELGAVIIEQWSRTSWYVRPSTPLNKHKSRLLKVLTASGIKVLPRDWQQLLVWLQLSLAFWSLSRMCWARNTLHRAQRSINDYRRCALLSLSIYHLSIYLWIMYPSN